MPSGLPPKAGAGASMSSRQRWRPPAAASHRRVIPDPGRPVCASVRPSARARQGEVSPQGKGPTANAAGPKDVASSALSSS